MAAYKSLEAYNKKIKLWIKRHPNVAKERLQVAGEMVREYTIKTHLWGPKMARGEGHPTNATLARRTGALARSLKVKVWKSGTRVRAMIGSDLKYAKIHEKGGVIKAKDAPYLVFEVDGHLVFVKSVKIPARPYLEPSVQAMRAKIAQTILGGLIEDYEQLS